MLKQIILKYFTHKLYGKRILWSNYLRIFCDSGHPYFHYIPTFQKTHYAEFWNIYGFRIYWLGREFNFCFGLDKHNLYE